MLVWQKLIRKYPDAYEEGLDAICENEPLESNPYPPDTGKWVAWRAGWFGR